MTACPDWSRLAAARDDGPPADAWRLAVDHLEACADCRPAALAADPLLVFRRLPRVETGAGDVEAMRQAVASLRRASRVAPPGAEGRVRVRLPAAAAARRLVRGLRRFAAVGVLAAASAGLWWALPGEPPATEPPAAAVPAATAPGAGDPSTWRRVGDGSGSADPVFMDLARPRAADVYEIGGSDRVVMVVDETLDV